MHSCHLRPNRTHSYDLFRLEDTLVNLFKIRHERGRALESVCVQKRRVSSVLYWLICVLYFEFVCVWDRLIWNALLSYLGLEVRHLLFFGAVHWLLIQRAAMPWWDPLNALLQSWIVHVFCVNWSSEWRHDPVSLYFWSSMRACLAVRMFSDQGVFTFTFIQSWIANFASDFQNCLLIWSKSVLCWIENLWCRSLNVLKLRVKFRCAWRWTVARLFQLPLFFSRRPLECAERSWNILHLANSI